MKHAVHIAQSFVFIGLLVGCTVSNAKKSNQTAQLQNQPIDNARGKQVYKFQCMACHQIDGRGIPGLYPPLSKNARVTGEKDYLIKTVLYGIFGEIEVNGELYNGVMTSYSNLSDEDIAAVLTYIRSSFGNNANEVSAKEVKAHR